MAKQKRKIGWMIGLAIGLACCCAVGVFAYLQRNNIEAFFLATKYSAEERSTMLTRNEAELLEKIGKEIPNGQIKPLTEEEEALLNSGEISSEEALQLIMGKTEQGKQENKEPTSGKEEPNRLQELLAQVYLMKSSYGGQIHGLIEQAKQEYRENKGKVSKFSIGRKYIGIAGSLEAQCDSQMEAILAEITAELKRTGGDLGLVEEIRSAYRGEKSAQKAELYAKYAS